MSYAVYLYFPIYTGIILNLMLFDLTKFNDKNIFNFNELFMIV